MRHWDMPNHDVLFLLPHGFPDGPGAPYYCPDCTQIAGLLRLSPELLAQVEIRYAPFIRPRPEIVGLVGEANQSCPLLVLDPSSPAPSGGCGVHPQTGVRFLDSASAIGTYWSERFGTPRPH